MRNELLGYLLGALEQDERARVESELRGDQHLQGDMEVLRRGLAPLEADGEAFEPPSDLWRRTVEFVFLRAGLYGATPAADAAAVSWPGPAWFDGPPPTRRWRMVDLSVAAGILVAAMSVVIPALIQSRANAQRFACQNRLHDVWNGIASFAGLHNGKLPIAALSEGFEGKAGIYAPVLRNAGYLKTSESILCPGSDVAAEDYEVTLDQLRAARGPELQRLVRRMGGTYACAIGYRVNGKYHPLLLKVGANFPLMADLPGDDGKPIGHHGGCGRNVLTADGRVAYTHSFCWPVTHDKNIYANDEGELDAGLRKHDTVLMPSGLGPLFDAERLQIRNVNQ